MRAATRWMIHQQTLSPPCEAVVDGLARSEALGEIPPRHAGLGSVDDRIDEQAISADGLGPAASLGQNRLQPLPLLVGQGMTMHAPVGSRRRREFKILVAEAPKESK